MGLAVDDDPGAKPGTQERRVDTPSSEEVVGGAVTKPPPSHSPAASPTLSTSIQGLLDRHADGESITAGAVVVELLDTHNDYLDKKLARADRDAIVAAGPVRAAPQHVELARGRWDPTLVPVLSGRHVILALAIDADLGWLLLQTGAIASLLDRWQPGQGTPDEPKQVVWDVLADTSRDAAEDQPMLAAALGAPAEWSIPLPHPATAIAWAPDGERLAFVAGDTVYEVAPGEAPRPITRVGADIISLAWGSHGLRTLQVSDGTAKITQVPKTTPLFSWPGVSHGLLSGDGTLAWLATSDGITGWTPGRTQPVQVAVKARPLALDTGGWRGLVGRSSDSVLITGLPPSASPSAATGADQPATAPSDWPPDAARALAAGPPRQHPCALLGSAATTFVAAARREGGVDVQQVAGPVVASIATGAEPVTSLASHPAHAGIAVAFGHQIGYWTLSTKRRSGRLIPGYDSDRVGDADLLDADRDARALAALIASSQLHPPVSIGLFGAWGSGKSFVLGRIERMLGDFTKQGAAQGYLERVEVVRFNAWHYAETNLWASLVDEVLRKIGPAAPAATQPQAVAQATTAAAAAEQQAEQASERVSAAETELEQAKRRFADRRRRFWLLGSVALLLLAGAIGAAAFGASAQVVAAIGTALALLGSLTAALDQVRKASDQADQLAAAGREGLGGLARLAGRPEELAVQAAATALRDRAQEAQAANAQAEQLRLEADHATQRLDAEPVRAILDELTAVTEYRDLLSLVTRTRERFASIDQAVRANNARYTPSDPNRAPTDQSIQRVVIAIDDLDRCPPDKVITVLEAVHLLFDFSMFVVLLAVDTRWLEQSLRIRYERLLGESGTASPADYLEKIIQVPLYLLPLDRALVRTMLTGLTGQPINGEPTPPTPVPDPTPPDPPDGQTVAPALTAHKGRSARPPLPAEVLEITPAEATAMSEVAPLLGTTPRTVKRFVNTYRLLKARTLDPERFDEPVDALGDHQIVAFLLALVTGHPKVAGMLLPALTQAPDFATINSIAAALALPSNPAPELVSSRDAVRGWLAEHADYAQAPAKRCSALAQEVGRFSFTPPTPMGPVASA
jgi:hypothetical protein